MKLLLDNNLPPALAHALRELSRPDGHEVFHLRDRFSANTEDRIWIETLSGEQGWAVVTHDLFNKGLEREVLRRAGLIVFMLDRSWSKQRYWDKAAHLVRWWPRIVELSEGMHGGAAFKVPLNLSGKGKVEQLKI